MPERLTRSIVKFLSPRRENRGKPKFPAYYAGCVVSATVQDELRNIGFREVVQWPFWGTSYLKRLPPLQRMSDRLDAFWAARDVKSLASFCYAMGRK